MPLTKADIIRIADALNWNISNISELESAAILAEAQGESLINLIKSTTEKIISFRDFITDKIKSEQLGLIKADEVEWSSDRGICQAKKELSDYKNRLGNLLGLSYHSEVANIF